nr:hypothetical protein [Tanacetum cinerariifolium]
MAGFKEMQITNGLKHGKAEKTSMENGTQAVQATVGLPTWHFKVVVEWVEDFSRDRGEGFWIWQQWSLGLVRTNKVSPNRSGVSFCLCAVTRATNSESDVLCCGRGGGRGRFVVVVVVVAVKIGAFVEDAGLRGERSMIGVDSGGIKEEA